jgi:hypothetical protein
LSAEPGSNNITGFTMPASEEAVRRVMLSLPGRGIQGELLDSKEAALGRLKELIPAGAGISFGASITLRQIGFEALLVSGNHQWRNLKGEMLAEKDPAKQAELRRGLVLADYFLGSVHAVTETGQLVIASNTGSQLPAYSFTARNVIWVAGTQKIVPTLEDGFRRVREYCAPMVEKQGLDESGRSGFGRIGKILVFENETPFLKRTVRLLLVREVLGY